MANYQNTAQGLATLGRGGDSTLVHMNPSEVAGLQNLAVQNGTSLTVNPNTGMPEAFNLSGLLPMVAGVGLSATGMSPLMAGLMIGGATAVVEGDIGAGLGAGLGAYGGANLGKSLDLLGAGGTSTLPTTTTGELVSEQLGSNLQTMNPTIPGSLVGPSGPGMTGFSSTAGGGTMGIPNAVNVAGTTTYNPIGQKDALGSSITEVAEKQAANVYNPKAYQPSFMDTTGQNISTQLAGPPQQFTPTPTTEALQYPTREQFMGGATQNTVPQQGSFNVGADMSSYTAPQSGVAQVSEDGLTGLANRAGNSFSNMGKGVDTLVNRFDEAKDILGRDKVVEQFDKLGNVTGKTIERIPLDNIDMAMKFGLPIAGGVMGGLEESDFQEEGVDMTEFEDNRFRGPEGQLNLSGKTTLNLNNPYGYAKGGAVEQGMEAAIARNIGKTYTPTAPVSAPVSAPVASSNINVGGFTSAPTNLTRGLGALNVRTGTVGQSPNAVAEAARLKAIEDAKPKTYSGQNVGGSSNTPFSVPTKFIMGQGTVPADYQFGLTNPYYRDIAGNYIRRAEGGPIPAAYAEGGYLGGGNINVQGDGMSDDIPANIDNEQPAALSEGEFVIPADVVSHIGNGSSEAGAKEFYGMMDRVRMARTGRKKQSPEIDPERFMPA